MAAPPPDDAITPLLRRPITATPAFVPGEWLRRQWRLICRPRIESGWVSVCGVNHARNQDAVLAAPPLFAVADGVGGGRAGELASSQMLAWCSDIPPGAWRRPEDLATALRLADGAVADALQRLNPGGRSATTFAGAWLGRDGRGCIAHVGDSRILQLRPSRGVWEIDQLTADQTYANLGEDPPRGGQPDDPARMIGIGAMGEPCVARLRMRENDWLLLCSDGLHRYVPAPILASMCQRDASAELHALAQRLVTAAQVHGSRDDISVVLVRRNPRAGVRAPFWVALAAVLALALLTSGAVRNAVPRITSAAPAQSAGAASNDATAARPSPR